MKIKTPNAFHHFADGLLEISSKSGVKYQRVPFQECKLGYGRFFAARTAQTQIDRVVRTPMLEGVEIYDTVIVNHGDRYRIELLQPLGDTLPPCLQLTLKCQEVHR